MSEYLKHLQAVKLGLVEKPVKEKKPIKKVGDKMKAGIKEYKKIRKEFLTRKIKCERKGCKKVSTEVHHKKGRIGELLTNVKYFMAVCSDCHKDIEVNPEWAKEQGYSLSRLTACPLP